MSRLDARLQKLEACIGRADEELYWQAMRDLQPAIAELHRRCEPGNWQLFFDEHARLLSTLPPMPASLQISGETERLRAELNRRLDETRERLERNAELLIKLQARRSQP